MERFCFSFVVGFVVVGVWLYVGARQAFELSHETTDPAFCAAFRANVAPILARCDWVERGSKSSCQGEDCCRNRSVGCDVRDV